MSRERRFKFGRPYLLTDTKDRVFDREPAIYVGRRDSDMKRPTLCAVCGEPLGSKGYGSFFLMGPNGRGKDMMVGSGCLKDRIVEEDIPTTGTSFMDTWERTVAEFPSCGRWYGTFLHHCIAKPYVRDRKIAERWDESVLGLPGVRYIMEVVDELFDDGWSLDAEKVLECGRVDLLATHPEKGVLVFDWKSDKAFDSHEAYVEQVCGYMGELSETGMQNISGYIVWIMKEKKEHVLFRGPMGTVKDGGIPRKASSGPIQCKLAIDMDGGEGIRWKSRKEHSRHRPFGDEVSFYIPKCRPSKRGYEFGSFEASPYREGERPQWFNMEDAEEGFYVSFICSDKRRSFSLAAKWKVVRPFECVLTVIQKTDWGDISSLVHSLSKIDDNGEDYVEFDVTEINRRLYRGILAHAALMDCELPSGTKSEWSSEDLQEGMKIRIPCVGERSEFTIAVETRPEKKPEPQIREEAPRPQPSESKNGIGQSTSEEHGLSVMFDEVYAGKTL